MTPRCPGASAPTPPPCCTWKTFKHRSLSRCCPRLPGLSVGGRKREKCHGTKGSGSIRRHSSRGGSQAHLRHRRRQSQWADRALRQQGKIEWIHVRHEEV